MFGGNKIRSLVGREILDSRGNPTVACRVILKSGLTAEAKVPSGASTGSHEAHELRDGGQRYGGKGVRKAVQQVNKVIAQALQGKDVTRQRELDALMCELDGTENKKILGANAILAASLACAQAAALYRRVPLWQSLRQTFVFSRQPKLPLATMNVLNGGAHAGWAMDVQECMIVPKQRTFAERLRCGSEVFHALAGLLKVQGFATTVGDEGGFAPALPQVEAAFALLEQAVEKAGYKMGKEVALAADLASSEWYDKKNKKYQLRAEQKNFTADALLKRYLFWPERFALESLEDPFAEDDWVAWKQGMKQFPKKLKIVGDDFFVTNIKRLEKGIKEKAANAILIKLNQIGTLSETADAIILAQQTGWATSISHRSGETADTTIADLAVACGSDYIKTGSLSRSERVEKYNRLLEIEGELEDA